MVEIENTAKLTKIIFLNFPWRYSRPVVAVASRAFHAERQMDIVYIDRKNVMIKCETVQKVGENHFY